MSTLAATNGTRADLRAHLATLPDSADLEPREVAALIPCSIEHLGRLARKGQFPQPHRPGGKMRRWELGLVRKFLREQSEAAQRTV